MKSFISLIVRRPITILMIIISVLILGLISLSRLSIDSMPNMQMPYISVHTRYRNAGPEEIEKSITKIVEGAVATVNNIKNITSYSRENSSDVMVEFNWGVNLREASEDIREALERIYDLLPDNADKPNIRKFATDDTSLMEVAIYGLEDKASLYNIAENQIAPKIKQAKGVAQAETRGGLKRQIKIDVNLNRLKAYNININQISEALSRDNNNLVGGQANHGFYKYTIRTMGEIESIDDIKNIAIDLKTNTYGTKAIIKGEESVSIAEKKESGANTVEVAKNVKRKLEEDNFPEGVNYEIMFNNADGINDAIKGVLSTAWQGGLFAIIILMIYMWNIRSVSVIAISIPLSIIITFTLMYFMNITLNVISLSGLVLGIGMMVDNSIVVLENIFYYRNEGYGKYSSAINGAYKVSLAISASTFTTIAVFMPFLYIEGMTSQMFRDLCITVAISMIASLLVALTIVPMFGARLVSAKKSKIFSKFEIITNKYIHSNISGIYNKILMFSIKNKKIILIPSIIFSIIILALGLKFIGKEGFPRTDEGQFMIMATMPIGTKSEQTASFVSLMEKDIKEIIKNDLKRFQSRIRTGSESSWANIRVELKSKKNRKIKNINEYIEIIRDKLRVYPCTINIWSLDSMRGDRNRGEFLRIELLTDDLIKAKELGDRVVNAISNISGIQYVWLQEDESNRELQIFVNRDIAAKMGLKVNDIAKIINTSFAGYKATTITPKNSDWNDIDVTVQLENSDKVTIEDIMEEIFGEIEDEHDRLNLKEEQVAPDEYIFSGRLEVDYLNEKYDLNLPENEEYETLAGLILYYNEDIPEEGERISIEDISFEIVSVKSARIEEVRVKI